MRAKDADRKRRRNRGKRRAEMNTRERRIVGIDPGLKGGMAMLEPDGTYVDGIRTPVLKRGKQTLIDASALRRWLHTSVDGHLVTQFVVEDVHSMPKQGLSSTFTFGRATGAVESWAMSYGVPVSWITPAVWKRDARLLKQPKSASRNAAKLAFGECHGVWDVAANEGIAEAALIALCFARSRE
jgi:crossover junction endodeoxyribonuclease RuvC